MWPALSEVLLPLQQVSRRYVEPFVGGGSTFFLVDPTSAVLSDINAELIDLYLGVQQAPREVWEIYESFPNTRRGYYKARAMNPHTLSLTTRAARLLFLNRTCFKGMWRHNSSGDFNVGYGGQSRRWAITLQDLYDVAKRLQNAVLRCADFEAILDETAEGDLIFVDPPYRRGYREQLHEHYVGGKFAFEDQRRLAAALGRASERGVRWVVTNSFHEDLLDLYMQLAWPVQLRKVGNGEILIADRATKGA